MSYFNNSRYGNESLTYFFSYLRVNNKFPLFCVSCFPWNRGLWYRMSPKHFLLKPVVLPYIHILVVLNTLSLIVEFCCERHTECSAPSFRKLGAFGSRSPAFAQNWRTQLLLDTDTGPVYPQTRHKVPNVGSQQSSALVSFCSTPICNYRQTGVSQKRLSRLKLLIQERTNEILACVCSLPVLNPHPKSILYLAEARSSK